MPLHPDLEPLITGEPIDVSTLEPAAFRTMVAAMQDGYEPVEQVAHVEDRVIADGVPVRIYRPAGDGPFQLLVYPVLDARGGHPSRIENKDGPGLTNDLMQWFTDQYVRAPGDVDDPDVSPLLAESFSGLPPAFVLTAEYDPLRDEGAEYADRLAAAGVPVTYRLYEGAIHGFWQMSRYAPYAQLALDECGDALRVAVGGG